MKSNAPKAPALMKQCALMKRLKPSLDEAPKAPALMKRLKRQP